MLIRRFINSYHQNRNYRRWQADRNKRLQMQALGIRKQPDGKSRRQRG